MLPAPRAVGRDIFSLAQSQCYRYFCLLKHCYGGYMFFSMSWVLLCLSATYWYKMNSNFSLKTVKPISHGIPSSLTKMD